jgi:hypothetical protein
MERRRPRLRCSKRRKKPKRKPR